MTKFSKDHFKKIEFNKEQIKQYLESSLRDLKIAKEDTFPEVRFLFSYQALIKAGITLLAHKGHVKVRSIPGHHVNILNKMSEILRYPDVLTIGNAMRMKRNTDLYGGGETVSDKEAADYHEFVSSILELVKKIVEGR
jgi:hypothetical protein